MGLYGSWDHLGFQQKSPNQILGTPNFEVQKRLSGSTLTFSRLDVHILQILKCVDVPGRSTNSIMPFHDCAPNLVHWLSWHQQKLAREEYFSISATLLKVWLHIRSLLRTWQIAGKIVRVWRIFHMLTGPTQPAKWFVNNVELISISWDQKNI